MLLQVDGGRSCLVPWNFALQLWFMLFCYELILLVLWGEKFSDKLQWLKWMTNMMYIILTTKYNVAKYKMHVTYWRKLNCQHPSSKDIPGQSAGGKLSHNILANMYQRNLINVKKIMLHAKNLIYAELACVAVSTKGPQYWWKPWYACAANSHALQYCQCQCPLCSNHLSQTYKRNGSWK